MSYIKTDIPGYVRDTESTAIINTDIESYQRYKMLRDERFKMRQLNDEINSMKEDINTIKTLLLEVLKK